MSAVDIFTAPRMKQIEDTTVVSGLVDPNGNLLLSTRAGEEINAGNVVGPQGSGFTYRGVWAEATTYAVDDVVTSNGSTFVVTTEHISSTMAPTADTPGANLALWAGKGEPGIDGAAGVDGADGIDGVDGADGIEGSTALPAGTISLWASDVAPSNWLICDGSAVSRTEYPSLFDAIGIKYGAGDGVNTFNLPNLKGKTPVGLDASQTEFDALAKIGGAKTHLLTAAQMPAHSHTIAKDNAVSLAASGWSVSNWNSFVPWANGPAPGTGSDRAGIQVASTFIGNTGGGAAHNILQPYQVVNFIIKVTSGDTPGDSELTQRVSDLETNFSAIPAGTIAAWSREIAPTNWLICDGSAVSRTTYASLFAAIETKYGPGDGSTTFNLPNLKGRVPVGLDSSQTEFDTLGETGGAKTHRLSALESGLREHTHVLPLGQGASVGGTSDVAARSSATGSANDPAFRTGRITDSTIQANSAGTYNNTALTDPTLTQAVSAHNNLQPYQVVKYIIKFTNGDTKGDSQLTERVIAIESGNNYANRLQDKMRKIQFAMTGGGIRKVTANAFSWSFPFRTMAGRDDMSLSGYFNITMPADGIVIPVIGHASVVSVTVAGGFIPTTGLGGYASLYYDLPIGSNSSPVSSRFRFVDHEAGPIEIPPSWVLVCTRNTLDPSTIGYRWGDGRLQDFWRPLSLQNGWVNYGSPLPNAAWKFRADGQITMRGTIKFGAVGTISTTLSGLGPEGPSATQVAVICLGSAGTGIARLDVFPNGTLTLFAYTAGGSNAHLALDDVAWYPSDI